jgi:glycine hydroxymethyltransferase
VVDNAKALGEELSAGGWKLVSGGTDTHLLLADLRPIGWTGKAAEDRFEEVHITANRNGVPFDDQPPTITSGVRVGTPAMTTRGFDAEDFRETGRIMVASLAGEDVDLAPLAARARTLLEKRPLYADLEKGYP